VGPTNLLEAFTDLLHMIEAQGGMPALSAHWSSHTKAQYVKQIRHVTAVLTTWEAVLLGEMGQVTDVHSPGDGQVTTLHGPPSAANEACGDRSADLISTPPPATDLFPNLEELTR
jgi:hypothetical protein